jgi:hypothetical protein
MNLRRTSWGNEQARPNHESALPANGTFALPLARIHDNYRTAAANYTRGNACLDWPNIYMSDDRRLLL